MGLVVGHNGEVIDRLRIFRDTVRQLLADGEEPRALQQAAYVNGEEDLGRPRPDMASEIADVALLWHSAYFQGLADRLVSGTSLVGWPGCDALTLARAVGQHDLVVTDRRLLVVDLGDHERPPSIVWERDRMAIVRIQRVPRFGQAGRIWIVMADGSAVSLMLGVISSAGARRVVEAWGEVPGDAR